MNQAQTIGCETCGHLACVCGIRKTHPDPDCKFRQAATCAVGIECEHGYDVCPQCDPCTCSPQHKTPDLKESTN